MIDREHGLSVVRQVNLLNLNRSSIYRKRGSVNERDLDLMRRLDPLHMDYPFLGSRRLAVMLRAATGQRVGHRHVATLMKRMGIRTLYMKPRKTESNPEHKVFPYLLRNNVIDHPDQVWAMDITYIPMRKGFVYLSAVMDWYSRKVLSWRVSNSLDAQFCLEAVQEAIAKYGKPEIFNTDQGSQFTSEGFVSLLQAHQMQISMDGRGAWMDNVFVERLWRSVKYEEVYLKAYDTVPEARCSLGDYLNFYNSIRPHQSLENKTPDEVYFNRLPEKLAA